MQIPLLVPNQLHKLDLVSIYFNKRIFTSVPSLGKSDFYIIPGIMVTSVTVTKHLFKDDSILILQVWSRKKSNFVGYIIDNDALFYITAKNNL